MVSTCSLSHLPRAIIFCRLSITTFWVRPLMQIRQTISKKSKHLLMVACFDLYNLIKVFFIVELNIASLAY
jgi:hypothetical protein